MWNSFLSRLHFALLKGTFVTIQHLWLCTVYRCNDVYLFPRFLLCGRKSIIVVVMWLIIKATLFKHFFFQRMKGKKDAICPAGILPSSVLLKRLRLLPLELMSRNICSAAFYCDHSSCISVTQQIVWLQFVWWLAHMAGDQKGISPEWGSELMENSASFYDRILQRVQFSYTQRQEETEPSGEQYHLYPGPEVHTIL